MKTLNDKALILKINLPTMEGLAFVFTNTWTREQNIRFHGNIIINHVTKTCGMTSKGMFPSQNQKHVTRAASQLQINE